MRFCLIGDKMEENIEKIREICNEAGYEFSPYLLPYYGYAIHIKLPYGKGIAEILPEDILSKINSLNFYIYEILYHNGSLVISIEEKENRKIYKNERRKWRKLAEKF